MLELWMIPLQVVSRVSAARLSSRTEGKLGTIQGELAVQGQALQQAVLRLRSTARTA